MNEGQARDAEARGQRARRYLEDEIWQEAWDTYRDRIISEIERAKSNDADTVMHLKRLWTAANAAKLHIEALVVDGRVAASDIQLIEKRGLMRRLVG